MKTLLKRMLARCGFSFQRLPPGLATGTDLARDLALVVGPRPHPCCIDAGANDGGTIDLLRRCLASPRIHAFEPTPTTFAALQANHRATSGVKLNHAGLGDTPGTLALQLFANHALNSFLHTRGLRLVDFYEKCRHNSLLSWCTALFVQTDKPPAA